MSSPSAFSNLMNQYGEQAQQEKVAEAHAEKRAETFRKVRRATTLLLIAGAFGAASYYHNEVSTRVAKVMEKAFFKSPYAEPEAKTKSKVSDIQAQAEKNNQVIESTFK